MAKLNISFLRFLITLPLVTVAALVSSYSVAKESNPKDSTKQTSFSRFYDIKLTGIDGTPIPLNDMRGKLILIVNTASQCGFTPQYAGLENLWNKYKEKGLVVIGVPSNDFGGQEPEGDAEIGKFTTSEYHISFPLAAKTSVTGDNAHDLYKWLESELGASSKPRWNFHKYLVSPNGKAIDWYSSFTSPESEKMIKAIEGNLP
jgi:glutathione peroxidase